VAEFSALDAERTILGAILVNNQALPEAEANLRAEHFADEKHRTIWRAMLSLSERDIGIDTLTLRDQLASNAELGASGGVLYLDGLSDGVPRITDVTHWSKIVRERALRRATLALGQRLVESAGNPALGTDEVIDRHSNQLNRLLESHETANTQYIAEVLKEAQEKLNAFTQTTGVTGVPTSIPDLDNLTNGLQPGSLTIIAARPSRGKSVLVTQLAAAASSAGFPGLVFSLEMPPSSVVQRMWLADAGISRFDLKLYERDSDWAQMAKSYGRLAKLPLWFDKRESPTLTQIRAVSRKFKATVGLKFIVIDYLQRIPVDGKVDRHVAVGDIAQSLKSLALALSIPVIVACQLNRDAEEKRPNMADLAESGRIERECDLIAALHPAKPEEWYEQGKDPEVELIVLKNREGATDTLKLTFERKLTRFVPLGMNWKGEL
jgi:replicative DNA helicase